MRKNITDDFLKESIKNSICWSDLLRKCDLFPGGGSYQWIQAKVKRLNLDVSHFLGKAAHAGPLQTGACKKKHWKEILIYDDKKFFREKSNVLRRAFKEYCNENNISIQCKMCNNDGNWIGKKLKLQINHVDENRINNHPINLEWLCPNCHDIETYKTDKKIKNYCQICKKEIHRKSKLCEPCHHKNGNFPMKFKISKDELYDFVIVKKIPFTKIGKMFGVSDNSIRKRCKKLEIPI